jgi:hypothetical protein
MKGANLFERFVGEKGVEETVHIPLISIPSHIISKISDLPSQYNHFSA